MRKKDIETVAYDWDDTVMKTFQLICEQYRHFAKTASLSEPDLETIKNVWGRPLIHVLASFWPQENPDKLVKLFYDSRPADFCVEPFPWYKETISRLTQAGLHLAVISSTPKKGLEQTTQRHNIDLSDHLVVKTGEDGLFHKPDHRVFDELSRKLAAEKVLTKNTIYVGDSLGDLRAARNRGIKFVAVLTGFTGRRQFEDENMDEEYILENFGQIPEWLGIIKK